MGAGRIEIRCGNRPISDRAREPRERRELIRGALRLQVAWPVRCCWMAVAGHFTSTVTCIQGWMQHSK